jgi:hypothetical protein
LVYKLLSGDPSAVDAYNIDMYRLTVDIFLVRWAEE